MPLSFLVKEKDFDGSFIKFLTFARRNFHKDF